MKLFGNSKQNRKIAAYARTLPPRLARDYGASQFYTPGQIARGIANLKLDPSFAIYAHAAFLTEDSFLALHPPMPDTPSYEEARAVFAAHRPSTPISDANFTESGAGFNGAALGQ
jgi:hypothetical protein